MKQIIITLKDATDLPEDKFNSGIWDYSDQSWLSVEIDGDVYENLTHASIDVAAVAPNKKYCPGEWDVKFDCTKKLYQ